MENSSLQMTPNENSGGAPIASPPKRSSLLLGFILILLICLFVAMGLLWKVARQWHKENEINTYFLTSVLHQQQTAQIQMLQQSDNMSQQIKQQQNQVLALNSQMTQFAQRSSGDLRPWKIAEIIYLVRIANLQLVMQHSVTNALMLLKQADSQLVGLSDPKLEPFHQALLKNILVLQNLAQIDWAEVTTQLSSLRDQVPDLSILVAPKPNTSVMTDTAHQEHKKWWQRAWDNIKASMQQLIIIRHQHESIPALMPPDEQMYLQENLQLLLAQAQWAILNYQPAVYKTSLKQAENWVQKYYVQNSATTQSFLKQLQALEAINIAPALPDLTPTLSLVNQEAQ